jgi:DNA-binding Lrp family transcriptional regulator
MYGFVLVSLNRGTEKLFTDYLKTLDFVKEAHYVFGEWDIIAKMEAENPEEFVTFVLENIRNRPEVKLSSTMIAAQSDK